MKQTLDLRRRGTSKSVCGGFTPAEQALTPRQRRRQVQSIERSSEQKTRPRKRALNLPAYSPTILNASNPRASRSACPTCQKGAHVRCRP
jgi:hypothetical protein